MSDRLVSDLLLLAGGLVLGAAVIVSVATWASALRIASLVAWAAALRCRFLFEPRDLWVGIFVQEHKRRVYVLPVPMFGLIVMWGHASDCPTSASGCWCGWDRDP